MNIAALLANAARSFGDRPALSVGDELRLTYAELQARVARLAGALRGRLGLVAGDRVALAMANRPHYVELLHAIWHAGLCAVPINARLHPREVEFILENCGVKLCFVTSDLAQELAALLDRVPSLERLICVDDADYERLVAAEPVARHPAERDELAWIFYTSGTTGRPKGAMLTHQNLLTMAMSYLCDIDLLGPEDCLLHLGPQSHAAGLFCLSHVAKATHQVLPASGVFDPAELIELIGRYRNSTFFLAPTMLRRFLDAPSLASAKIDHVRTILCGAAPIYVEDVKRTLAAVGPRFWNGYGQGECPCTITALPKALFADSEHEHYAERIASVGFARTGVEVRLVDPQDRDLPAGEVGEILVRGDTVMQGYWDNAEASATALRGGWLHTGDLGVLDLEGFLTLKDRSKDLIISGGSNIYPREVEEVLLTHRDIAEVAVVGAPDREWGERTVAFVVARAGRKPTLDELDRLCLGAIARYKRPREYRFVVELPKNHYGKVLKAELRKQAAEAP
jgi:acyl-CoA synthetase (AMP-forming)/AMP-acid ligase II